MALHNSTAAYTTTHFLRQRLLQDIRELQDKPYPGIAVHIHDNDLNIACLVISPEGEPPLHMTMMFPPHYPLDPPKIKMNSNVLHPNVFQDYICMDMLNTAHTPAYTLKGICIQVLSFFASDTIDQEDGSTLNRKEWTNAIEDEWSTFGRVRDMRDRFQCKKCGFGVPKIGDGAADTPMTGTPDAQPTTSATTASETADQTADSTALADKEDGGDEPNGEKVAGEQADGKKADSDKADGENTSDEEGEEKREPLELIKLPEDILLLFCDYLDDESLYLAARAWNGFGRLIRSYNIIRTRDLQCFTLKRGFKDLDLGIGVHVSNRPRAIKSEFDLISRDAYELCGVRRSTQGLNFQYWLPLPISEKHWDRVRKGIDERLNGIARVAGVQGTLDTVLYNFMNEIVVQLSTDAEKIETRNPPSQHDYVAAYMQMLEEQKPKSTLTHASEKAIESYFQLFHLLLCLAIERPSIAEHANSMLKKFIDGQSDKQNVPNLGHLLIMILICEGDVSQELTKALIKEAVTRNVVWMLEGPPKGKDMAELSFMEESPVSEYRLQTTFEAGKTSYRIFMFLNLMWKVINHARMWKDEAGVQHKMTLLQLRDELFRRHGAPPNGAAKKMAEEIRKIQQVNSFPQFLSNMGLQPPTATSFTDFLRKCVKDSMDKGYSKWALSQEAALGLRLRKEPGVAVPEGMQAREIYPGFDYTFFPGDSHYGGGNRGGRGGFDGRSGGRGGGHGGRGGYGRGRGRGRGGY